jgi:DNA polymerase-3 subunit epsilon
MENNQKNNNLYIEEIANILEKSNSYQVLKRFEKIEQYNTCNGEKKLLGIYLDTETTGLDYKKDKIIELALVTFEYSLDGRIYKILDSYSSFQDPGILLSEEVSRLTGITNDMVKVHIIDNNRIEEIVRPASLIIAHNSSFDRKFIEKQFPIFQEKPWGCSYAQIPWNKENISTAKLDYLAYKLGFFYNAHRAEVDCLVGIHILSQILPVSKELAFKSLLDSSLQSSYIIWSINAPFASKDILKKRGYKWNPGDNGKPRSWFIEVQAQDKASELEFLSEYVYKSKETGQIMPIVKEINAFNRFSMRI